MAFCVFYSHSNYFPTSFYLGVSSSFPRPIPTFIIISLRLDPHPLQTEVNQWSNFSFALLFRLYFLSSRETTFLVVLIWGTFGGFFFLEGVHSRWCSGDHMRC